VATDANGFYVFIALPLVRSLTLHVVKGPKSSTRSITLDYGSPTNLANFTLT
jgi:hypothetical protein